jgi:hypothetical protein
MKLIVVPFYPTHCLFLSVANISSAPCSHRPLEQALLSEWAASYTSVWHYLHAYAYSDSQVVQRFFHGTRRVISVFGKDRQRAFSGSDRSSPNLDISKNRFIIITITFQFPKCSLQLKYSDKECKYILFSYSCQFAAQQILIYLITLAVSWKKIVPCCIRPLVTLFLFGVSSYIHQHFSLIHDLYMYRWLSLYAVSRTRIRCFISVSWGASISYPRPGCKACSSRRSFA